MFSLFEASTWTTDEVLAQIKAHGPKDWATAIRYDGNQSSLQLLDADQNEVWAGFGPDLKVLGLDCLGWLLLRSHTTRNPAWAPRTSEVPLYQPVKDSAAVFEVPDLDPDQVAAVYKAKKQP